MSRQLNRQMSGLAQQRALLVALSEDLALPLTHIKTSVELINADGFGAEATRIHANAMALSVEAGLQLVEAYRLLLKSDEILQYALEPVSIGAVFDEVAHSLNPYAAQHSTRVMIDVQGRFAPVMAHEPSLRAALEVLSSSLIRAQVAQSHKSEYQLVLGAHRSPEGFVTAGVFSNVEGLSDSSLKAARSLVGRAHQPLPAMPPGTASGILLADMLCSSLWQPLRNSAHLGLGGLATNLPISKQLSFV